MYLMKVIKSSYILYLLYFVQGLIIGLVYHTLPIILKERYSFYELSFYSWTKYPFGLKIMWAPLVDSYFLPTIGKRRFWIMISHIVVSVLFLTLALFHSILFSPDNFIFMSLLVVFLMIMMAIQDIAVDGWGVSLCSEVST